ncbi:hypothetical protein O181_082494 [Austropuccinia psidii MF-1]|uniref:Uncharacterized protein n=1 Tax=Austropuccinia psidii MF-1 TaxID=1389203 RepID=A0A9Q3FPT2_9BASI|nr:hypothetical protein [Austropuccinia psidii MF-1]
MQEKLNNKYKCHKNKEKKEKKDKNNHPLDNDLQPQHFRFDESFKGKHPSRNWVQTSQIIIKVEQPQSQQCVKHQLGLSELRNTKIPSCITKLSQGSEFATQHGYPIPKTDRSSIRITAREGN